MAINGIAASAPPFAIHWSHYPRSYIAPRATSPGIFDQIDGDLSKEVWSNAPFSDLFDDIRGEHDAPPEDRPSRACQTQFKMMWDENYLYIGAILKSDMETVATFTKRNSPIFQEDSDFEVFIDPEGSNLNYKELELNAINTVWNLMLDHTYIDGGVEHSGRIAKPGEALYYDVRGQKTATRLLSGSLNDPQGATWSVEIALAHKDTLSHPSNGEHRPTPDIGNHWRINFSRVERQGKINWTWVPQIVWNPDERRYGGLVNMHLPDAWGYVVFGDEDGNSPTVRDPSWPAKLAAMNVYYAQHRHKAEVGSFASHMKQLSRFLDAEVIEPFVIDISKTFQGNGRNGFVVTVNGNPDGSVVLVRDDRQVVVARDASQGDFNLTPSS